MGEPSTTLFFPSTYTPYIGNAADTPTPVIAAGGSTVPPKGGFILYLSRAFPGLSEPTTINVDALQQPLNKGSLPTSLKVWQGYPAAFTTVQGTEAILSVGETILVPVSRPLSTEVRLSSLTESFDRSASQSTAPSQAGLTQTATGTSTNSASITNNDSTSATTPHMSQTPTGQGISQTTFNGAVAGGTIAGVLFGALVCALVAFCCFRRRRSSARTPRADHFGSSGSEDIGTNEKAPRAIASSMSATGWQKHLPQEEGDRKIGNAFQTLYHLIQMHVDGYYGDKASGVSIEEATASLKGISEDGIHNEVSSSSDTGPLLQAILTRWIIHRISLRSSAEDSLLPSEYTRVPETCNWNMERGGHSRTNSSETRQGK